MCSAQNSVKKQKVSLTVEYFYSRLENQIYTKQLAGEHGGRSISPCHVWATSSGARARETELLDSPCEHSSFDPLHSHTYRFFNTYLFLYHAQQNKSFRLREIRANRVRFTIHNMVEVMFAYGKDANLLSPKPDKAGIYAMGGGPLNIREKNMRMDYHLLHALGISWAAPVQEGAAERQRYETRQAMMEVNMPEIVWDKKAIQNHFRSMYVGRHWDSHTRCQNEVHCDDDVCPFWDIHMAHSENAFLTLTAPCSRVHYCTPICAATGAAAAALNKTK